MIKRVSLVLLWAALQVPATVLDTNFTQSTYRTGTGGITCMAWAPDGSNRLFLTIKDGPIRVIVDSALQTFYTLSPYTNSECGVLGICFDPNYTANKYIYVFYTPTGSKQKIIRVTDNNNVGQDTVTIVDNLPTAGNNHDGGGISIGPDGKLYWAIGDLGNGTGVDLDTTTLAAKVGRANLDGTPAAGNPAYNLGDGVTARDYIWAFGFRNPFTHTWDPRNNRMIVNVVGTSWEQIFVVDVGDHAGYNNYEGGSQPTGYIDPIFTYSTNGSHGIGGCITGGAFYTGSTFPSAYQNDFFFGDYNVGKVIRITFDTNYNRTDSGTFATGISGITDVSVGPDGDLYCGTMNGNVYRFKAKTITQGIDLSVTAISVSEGDSGAFTVRLNAQPSSNITVNIARTSGSTDLSADQTSLTFTSSNWSAPQTVNIIASEDADAAADTALFSLSSSGLPTRAVTATTMDNDQQSLLLSDTALNITEGGSGQFTVRLAYQPGFNVTVNVGAQTSGFSEIGGVVTVEAENADSAVSRGGQSWTPGSAAAGFSGAGYMEALPDQGSNVNTGYETSTPELQYEIDFSTPGTYYVWIRGEAIDGASNTLHAGLDGQVVAGADRIEIVNFGAGFAWTNGTMDAVPATITVTAAGKHTLNLWMREDGFKVDKVVLTTDNAFSPSGTGPAESPRGSGGDPSVSVTGGSTLTFTPSDWNQPKTVTLSAAEDTNLTDGQVTIVISSSGLASQTVAVTAQDNDLTATELFGLIPNQFSLSQNVPNPFNPSTAIRFAIPRISGAAGGGRAVLVVNNLRGQRVKTLFNGPAAPGFRTAHWDGRDKQGLDLPSGVYFCRLAVSDGAGRVRFEGIRKMIRMR